MWRNGLAQTLTASQTEAVTADPLGLLSFQAWRFLLVPCGLFRIWPKVLICNLLRALWTWINTDKYKTTHFKMLFPLFFWFPSVGIVFPKNSEVTSSIVCAGLRASLAGVENPRVLTGSTGWAAEDEAEGKEEGNGSRTGNLRSEHLMSVMTPSSFSLAHSTLESESISHSVLPDSWDPMDYSLLDSSVHGILQARILEWVAMPSSRGSSTPRDQTWVSCLAGRLFTTEPLGKPIPAFGAYLLKVHGLQKEKVEEWVGKIKTNLHPNCSFLLPVLGISAS